MFRIFICFQVLGDIVLGFPELYFFNLFCFLVLDDIVPEILEPSPFSFFFSGLPVGVIFYI